MSESPTLPPAAGESTNNPAVRTAVAEGDAAAAVTENIVEAPPTAPASAPASEDIHAPPASTPSADTASALPEDTIPAASATVSAEPAAMPEPEPVEHGIGVLLVNLGTPDAPDAPAIRRYLKEFLGDPRVIENNSLLWKAVLTASSCHCVRDVKPTIIRKSGTARPTSRRSKPSRARKPKN